MYAAIGPMPVPGLYWSDGGSIGPVHARYWHITAYLWGMCILQPRLTSVPPVAILVQPQRAVVSVLTMTWASAVAARLDTLVTGKGQTAARVSISQGARLHIMALADKVFFFVDLCS